MSGFDLAQAQYDAAQPADPAFECEHRRCDERVGEDDRFCFDHQCAWLDCENGVDDAGDAYCVEHDDDEED